MNVDPGKVVDNSKTSRSRKGGLVVPNEPTLLQRVGARMVCLFVGALSKTLRYKIEDNADFLKSRQKAIFCVWHNRLALCVPIYNKIARQDGVTPGMAAMASASKDGAFLAAIIRCFGVHPARGSSSRRGPQAMLELTTWAERGYDLAITPDGPRGPRYHVQEGAISLAQLTGLPIIPCSYDLSWRIRVNSWDGFLIPLPFSKCEVRIGKSLMVPRDASDEERLAARAELEKRLRDLSRE